MGQEFGQQPIGSAACVLRARSAAAAPTPALAIASTAARAIRSETRPRRAGGVNATGGGAHRTIPVEVGVTVVGILKPGQPVGRLLHSDYIEELKRRSQ